MSTFVYMESYTRRVYLLGYHGAPLSCLSCMHMKLLSDDCKDTVHSLPAILIKINTSLNLSNEREGELCHYALNVSQDKNQQKHKPR